MVIHEVEVILNSIFLDKLLQLENLRNLTGIDVESNDRLKNSLSNFSTIKFDKRSKFFLRRRKNYLQNKSDMTLLIRNSSKGIKVYNIINSYDNSKNDLLDLAKISGKNRKLIMIRDFKKNGLTIFPLTRLDWIQVSKKTVQQWHINQKLN